MSNSINHQEILGAYLGRLRDADLAVILDAGRRQLDAAMNGNNAMQLDAAKHMDAMVDYAVKNISDYDLVCIEQAIKAWR
jgi:hypothetical protein